MKLICDPCYTLSDTRKCVTNFALTECARYVLARYPDSFVYYIKPDERMIFEKELEVEFPGRVKYFEGKYFPTGRVYEFLWRPEWFKDIVAPTGYAWDWDIIISTRGPAMGHVKLLNHAKMHDPKQIVLHDHFPFLNFKSGARGFYGKDKDLELMTLTSYALSDFITVGADYEVKGIIKTARRLLSPSIVRKLKKKVTTNFVIPTKLDDQYPLNKKPLKKGETRIGIFTQRIGKSGRHPTEVLDSFFYSFVKRKKGIVEFQLSTNSMKGMSEEDLQKYSFMSFYKATREEFYERLKKADFCISFSTTEGMPTSLLEAIMWGCIPVFIDSDWARDMTGKDYPLLFKTFPEAVGMINSIIDQPAKMFKMYQEWYKTYFLEYLYTKGTMQTIMDEAVRRNKESALQIYASKVNSEMVQIMVDYIIKKGFKRFLLFDLLELLYKDKLIRHNPQDMHVGFAPQIDMRNYIPIRHPKYYGLLHSILAARPDWERGLEVGEIITKK